MAAKLNKNIRYAKFFPCKLACRRLLGGRLRRAGAICQIIFVFLRHVISVTKYNMEVLNIEIVNPKAKTLLMNLAEMLAKLRRNEAEVPSLEEITEEVETVRQARYEKKNQNNY
jgi:hypothetical protein